MRGFRDLTDLSSGPQAGLARPLVGCLSRVLAGSGLGLLLLGGGCGPVGYLQQVHGKARAAVAEAKRAGAEEAAPYEYTSAVAYLNKAEEEGDHAEYQVAIEYGRRSEDLARRARAVAERPRSPDAAPPEPGKGHP